jgi:hypothetical protein
MTLVVMSSRTMSITEAVDLVSDSESHFYLIKNDLTSLTTTLLGVPLFSLTNYSRKHLELYEACNYQPTIGHSMVQEWANK